MTSVETLPVDTVEVLGTTIEVGVTSSFAYFHGGIKPTCTADQQDQKPPPPPPPPPKCLINQTFDDGSCFDYYHHHEDDEATVATLFDLLSWAGDSTPAALPAVLKKVLCMPHHIKSGLAVRLHDESPPP